MLGIEFRWISYTNSAGIGRQAMSQAQISLVLHATNQTHVAIEQLQYYNIYCVSVHDCCVCSGHQFIAICFSLTQLAPGRLMQHCPASVTWTDTDWIGWLLEDTLGWKHKQIWKWLRKGCIVHQYYLSSRTLPTQSTLWDKGLSCHNSRPTQQPPSSEEPKQKKLPTRFSRSCQIRQWFTFFRRHGQLCSSQTSNFQQMQWIQWWCTVKNVWNTF